MSVFESKLSMARSCCFPGQLILLICRTDSTRYVVGQWLVSKDFVCVVCLVVGQLWVNKIANRRLIVDENSLLFTIQPLLAYLRVFLSACHLVVSSLISGPENDMIQVCIPRYRLVDDLPNKPHYVYIVNVFDAGRHYKVERRYSAFHSLHRELRKHYSTPVFPPKRVRSCQTKVLEYRRQCLEQYLQVMIRFGPCRDQVLAFLGINKSQNTVEQAGTTIGDKPLGHQPIYNYKKDPFVDYERKSNLPDVVTEGVLMAFYGKVQ